MKVPHMKNVLLAAALLTTPAFAGGTIAGTVGFKGTAPKAEKLKLATDPGCKATDADDPSFKLSKDGKAVQEVFVRITKGAPAGGAAPANSVVIDQQGCLYHPFIQGAVRGQKLQVKNSDGTLHNVHAFAGTEKNAKTIFNSAQPPKAKDLEKAVKSDGDVVKLKCDVHPWMTAYVIYSDHPYFAVSGADGKFEIKDVPPGTYTVETWHEKLGTSSAEVKVEDGKTADPKFVLANK
jgi:hypothetical protein